MGKIITLNDNPYSYELPSLPPERTIWYVDLPRHQQYWKTPHVKNFPWLDERGQLRNVKHMTEKDRISYINYWRDVYEQGLWIMVDGEPTYLTGMHIEHLVFNKFEGNSFIYLESQRERFYFRDLTDKDILCDGRCWAKGRRVGITMEEVTQSIHVVNDDFGNHVNLQSDTHPKCKSTLLTPIIDTFVRREPWLREIFYSSNGKMPRASLELKDATIVTDGNFPLGGTVRAFPTTQKAKDGEHAMLDVVDEGSKWTGVSLMETVKVNQKTIVNPGKRGKQDVLSTTGEDKDAEKAVKDWHQLIADSNPLVRNANGKTNSGLYLFFVAYIHSLELLENLPAIKDVFGRINKDMAEEYIWNKVNQYQKDSKEYTHELYRMPMTLKHCLLTATGQGIFSKIKISTRLDELRGMSYDNKPYVIGSLEYDGNGKVYFESNEERRNRCEKNGTEYIQGYWMVAIHPYFDAEKNIDTRNRCRKIGNVWYPPVNQEFGWGFDPIRFPKNDTTSSSLSEAAIIVGKKFDYYGTGIVNRYAALYLYRPDDPDDAIDEAIKAALYWSAAGMHERTMEQVKKRFDEKNCLPLLMKSKKDDHYGMVVDSFGKMVQNGTKMLVSKFSVPKTPEDIDQYAEMPFEPCLVDMDAIDLKETTKFDTYMAMLELEYGLDQIEFTNAVDSNAGNLLTWFQEINPTRN